jgi:tetratricopeptide (TPR) repeat protein
MDQLPLFLDEYVLLNDATNALVELRLDAALVFLTNYRDLYKTNRQDIEEKLAIVAFLQEQLAAEPPPGPERPCFLFNVWRSFEAFCDALTVNKTITDKMRAPYFQKIAETMKASSLTDGFFLAENIPAGYVYLQTGDYDRAIRSLQTCLLTMRDNAAIFGYLGDAYWARGNKKTARNLYFEACLIAPCSLDWEHLRDDELRKLFTALPDDYDGDPAISCEWLGACGYIRGLFEPKAIRTIEEINAFNEKYIELKKAFQKTPDPRLAARLFMQGIVLCDNEPFLRNLKGIDFADIRRDMKSAAPSLFEEYIKAIGRRKK